MNPAETMRDAGRQRPGHRRVSNPQVHLRRRVLLRDGGLRRPGAARHDLSRALGLHLAARPADRHRPRPRRRDPPAGGEAGSRRAPVPGRADRPRRAAAAARPSPIPTASRAIPAAIPTIWSITSASPASARSPAGAATGDEQGRGAPNAGQLDAYIAERLLLEVRPAARGEPTSSRATAPTSPRSRDSA